MVGEWFHCKVFFDIISMVYKSVDHGTFQMFQLTFHNLMDFGFGKVVTISQIFGNSSYIAS